MTQFLWHFLLALWNTYFTSEFPVFMILKPPVRLIKRKFYKGMELDLPRMLTAQR